MRTSVIIAGAGPVGLTLALELGRRGVAVTLLEQLPRGGHQPRAKTTNIRSMAHFHRWGLADKVKAASPLASDYPRDIIFATRLFGQELARFPDAFYGTQDIRDERFPEPAQWIPQYTIESVLRDALAALPHVQLLFDHRVVAVEQDDAGVSAQVEADGRASEIRGDYLVGADGGRSTVRDLIGAVMEGMPAYMRNFLAVYEAPGLAQRMPLDPAISYWLVNPDAPAVTGPMDRGDKWFFSTQLKGDTPVYDHAEAKRRISLAIGADTPFEILESDTWQAHRLLADRYRRGRIFLAGDACHLHPPMGGYGMNMGIGDGVDLGWKLAAVLAGWGGEALLDSYEVERRAVARLVIDEAAENYSFVTHHMVRDAMEGDEPENVRVREQLGAAILQGKAREFRALNVVLGLRYDSGIIIPDGSTPPPWDPMIYHAEARPGALAPHHWLDDGSSLYDHFGADFTLLALPSADGDRVAAFEAAAARLKIPLTILRPAHTRDIVGLTGLYGSAMTLIRPDQHVAWQGNALTHDAAGILQIVTGRAAGDGRGSSK